MRPNILMVKSSLSVCLVTFVGLFTIDGEQYSLEEIKKKWPDGVVVKGDLNLSGLGLTKLPFKIKSVGGNFYCCNNNMASLQDGPEEVGGDFNCFESNLLSLEGAPKSVGGSFICSYNNLTSLKWAPQKVGYYFNCSENKKKFTEKEVRAVCEVSTHIFV